MKLVFVWSLCLFVAAGVPLRIQACPIPVYQYALEHWEADPYEITVMLHRPLSPEQLGALDRLERAARGEILSVNLNLTLHEPSADAPDGNEASRLIVHFPRVSRIARAVWSGDLTRENVDELLQSQQRRELGEALATRTSAVWIFLESGDVARDRAVLQLLETQLQRLEREILVPETAEWGGEAVTIDHRVNFRILRLQRTDPAEQMFIRMLLATEPDLTTDFSDQPMVFPVYGRGYILYALVGRGINEWTIAEAATFLTGPCSCQIKADNPGIDLLMDMDWASRVQPMTPAAVGTTTGTGAFLQRLETADDPETNPHP